MNNLRVEGGGKTYRRLSATKDKPKQKKSYIHWIVIACLAVLVIAIVVAVTVFKVKDVQYEGGEYYAKEELNELIFGTDSPNALHYNFFGNKNKEIPFVEKYDVDIKWPNKMSVTIYEKPIVGYISYMGCNMYFDREGVVVESSTQCIDGVVQVYGLKFKNIVLNAKLDVGDDDMFARILELTQGFEKHELDIDRIIFDSSYEVVLDIGDVRVELGDPRDCTERLYVLKRMSDSLEGLKGTLQLADYDGTDASIIFTKEK